MSVAGVRVVEFGPNDNGWRHLTNVWHRSVSDRFQCFDAVCWLQCASERRPPGRNFNAKTKKHRKIKSGIDVLHGTSK